MIRDNILSPRENIPMPSGHARHASPSASVDACLHRGTDVPCGPARSVRRRRSRCVRGGPADRQDRAADRQGRGRREGDACQGGRRVAGQLWNPRKIDWGLASAALPAVGGRADEGRDGGAPSLAVALEGREFGRGACRLAAWILAACPRRDRTSTVPETTFRPREGTPPITRRSAASTSDRPSPLASGSDQTVRLNRAARISPVNPGLM